MAHNCPTTAAARRDAKLLSPAAVPIREGHEPPAEPLWTAPFRWGVTPRGVMAKKFEMVGEWLMDWPGYSGIVATRHDTNGQYVVVHEWFIKKIVIGSWLVQERLII